MKKRSSFGLIVGILSLIVVAAELFSRRPAPIRPMASPTSTPRPVPTEHFEPFPTHYIVTVSPTSIPLQATYTSIAGETADVLATQTLLPIETPTLIFKGSITPLSLFTPTLQPSDIPPTNAPTPTLIFFPSPTFTPFRGTATPPVPVAYSMDGKAKDCYKGPSTAYIRLDSFKLVRIAGRDATDKWWYILIYKGQGVYVSCWVQRDQVTTGGNLSALSVTEPETPLITQVKLGVPGEQVKDAVYTASIICDDAGMDTMLHFSAQIFADGPMDDIGYRWETSAPSRFKIFHTPIKGWDAPAEIKLDLPVPSIAGVYSLSLRTTFPMEVVGELQVVVQCR